MNYKATAALAAIFLAGCQSATYPTAPASKPLTVDAPYQLTASDVAAVKAGVASSLKDPTSPLFGEMKAVKGDTGVVTVCGYVNGKNSYGGYVGDKPFIGSIVGDEQKKGFVVIGMGGSDIDTQVTFNVCRQKGIHL